MVRRAAITHPSIPFRVGSFEAIPAGAGAFDAVVGNFVFNHVGRPELALAEARRVLRSGGWLALSTWDAPRHNRLLGLMLDAIATADAPPPPGLPAGPTNFRADEELRELFERAGFAQVGVSHLQFDGAGRIGGRAVGRACSTRRCGSRRWSRSRPPEVQARIRDAFDRLVEAHRRADGSLAIPVAVQVTRGRRP